MVNRCGLWGGCQIRGVFRSVCGLHVVHYIIDGAAEGVGELAAGFGGIEGIALRGGGVEAECHHIGALKHQELPAPTGVFGIYLGCEKQFGEVAHDEDCFADVGLRRKVFEQVVADGTGGKECGTEPE